MSTLSVEISRQDLVFGDRVAHLLGPPQDDALGHGLSQLRHRYGDSHRSLFIAVLLVTILRTAADANG